MKCRECFHYIEISPTKGACFGIEIDGDRDPKDSPKCQGKYFKPRKQNTATSSS